MKLNCTTFLISTILIFGYTQILNAQTPRYDWTKQIGSFFSDDAKDVAIASDNSIYMVGQFMDNVDFDPGPNSTTINATIANGYIGHYTTNGALINVIPISSAQTTNCVGIEIDDSNNVYVSGNFSGTVDFNPGGTTTSLTATGTSDLFIAKYNSNHLLVWVRQYGGTLNNFNTDLDLMNNRLVVNGRFNGTINFTTNNGATTTGAYDIYALCIDVNGNYIWANTFGNTGNEDSRSVCFDIHKNIYLAGTFTGTLDLNPSSTLINNIVSNGTNGGDVFIVKLDSLGAFIWVKTLNGGGAEFIYDLKTNGDLLYVNGGFSWTVDFDPGPNFDTLTNQGGIDAFAWQLDLNGNHKWVRRVGNSNSDFYDGRTIAFSKAGKPYFLGIFEGTANFNAQGNQPMTSHGSFDFYVWALEQNGDYIWSKSVGGVENDIALGIATDSNDNIIIAGFFRLTVDFNPWNGQDNFTAAPSSSNLPDIFLTKWRNCESNKSVNYNSCQNPYIWNNQTYTNPGAYQGVFLSADSCDSTVVLNLTFTEINTSTTVNQQTITANQNAAIYQWYNCNNWQPIVGANQQMFTSNQGGTFAAVITLNACSDTTACITLSALPLSNIESNFDLILHPNPTTDILYINSYSNLNNLNIYSTDGKIIYHSNKIPSNIDVSSFPNGLYYLQANDWYGKKICKQWIKN